MRMSLPYVLFSSEKKTIRVRSPVESILKAVNKQEKPCFEVHFFRGEGAANA